jgi:competence protein ComEA
MKRALWNGVAACVAIAALVVSPAALAAKKKTPTPAAAASEAKSDKSEKAEKVNLNTASEKEIADAKGVGAKLAKELVKNRPYRTWEEVSNVKGVGSGKKLDSLKKVLKLSEGVGAAAAKEEPAAEKRETRAKKSKSSSKGEEAAPAAAGAAAGGSSRGGAGATAGSAKDAAAAEASSPSRKSSSSSAQLAPGERINLNTASAEELEKLPEIGPVKAAAIVEYRKTNGKFSSIEDVMKVSGIKEGTFAKIKDHIVVR